MFNDLINKLKSNDKCDLSIDELKILYGIDYDSNYSLYKYIEYRSKYNDLVKIFGKSFVAQSIDEVSENTIAYVGNLSIDKKLPTYNLKYMYGSLYYELDKIYNLENLEVIYGDAYFPKLEKAEGLKNLKYIGGLHSFGFEGVSLEKFKEREKMNCLRK